MKQAARPLRRSSVLWGALGCGLLYGCLDPLIEDPGSNDSAHGPPSLPGMGHTPGVAPTGGLPPPSATGTSAAPEPGTPQPTSTTAPSTTDPVGPTGQSGPHVAPPSTPTEVDGLYDAGPSKVDSETEETDAGADAAAVSDIADDTATDVGKTP